MRRRLLKQFPPDKVDEAIDRLKERGLIDDAEFARFWRDNREQHRPRSMMMLKQELGRLGVPRATVNQALEELDEEASAFNAGRRYLRRLRTEDGESFHAKMSDHLRRRGFGYSVARKVARELWEELADPVDGDVDGHTEE